MNAPHSYVTWFVCVNCGCKRPPAALREVGDVDGRKLYACSDATICAKLKA
jgi:hypothetical protein